MIQGFAPQGCRGFAKIFLRSIDKVIAGLSWIIVELGAEGPLLGWEWWECRQEARIKEWVW